MKRIVLCLLMLSMLLSVAVVGASATISQNVTVSSWEEAELQPIYVQMGLEIFSELNQDYLEYWWEDEIPELNGEWCGACNINMRGFAMSHDGRYYYIGTLNGGDGVRGVIVYDNVACKITDLYYAYDGEAGDPACPFSYAKGMSADDRGYLYVGFSFSYNYNIVNLGIAKQQDDGTLEEVYYDAVYEFGNPGDSGGVKVGSTGVDVVKMGDKYYCYVVTNYNYDAIYCYDVTDPANPKLNEDFGDNGVVDLTVDNNVIPEGLTLSDAHYLDVDEDGTIWIIIGVKSAPVRVLKIAPDGSASVDSFEAQTFYSVEHVGGYLLLGDNAGEFVEVRDDTSYEVIARISVPEGYGDRIPRLQVVNDVLFVCDAGNDDNMINAIHAAPLSADGYEFYNQLVANLSGEAGDTSDSTESDSTESEPVDSEPAESEPAESQPSESMPAESESVESQPADSEPADSEPADSSSDTAADDTADANTTDSVAESNAAETDAAAEGGCASFVGFASAGLILSFAAAAVVLKKKD